MAVSGGEFGFAFLPGNSGDYTVFLVLACFK